MRPDLEVEMEARLSAARRATTAFASAESADHFFKHRAEGGRLYYRDHHLPRVFADLHPEFEHVVWDTFVKSSGTRVEQFGLGDLAGIRVLRVPSLPRLASLIVNECKALDQALQDPVLRTEIELHFAVSPRVYEPA